MRENFHRRLLAFARRLHGIDEFGEMVAAVADEIRDAIGYQTAWLAIFDLAARDVRILAIEGDKSDDVWAAAPVFPIDSDPYMLRILSASEPQVVVDAQTDPDVNRAVVEALGNRTIINVPMRLVDQPYGALGTGTFGDEGVRVPSEDELAFLVGIAGQLVTAAARLVIARERAEAARHRAELERRLEQRQRLESLGQLAGGVAHDFNNLLTVILATTELMLDGDLSAGQRDDLDTIFTAANRASELTQRLLALGKRQHLKRRPTLLSEVVQDVVSMTRRVIPANIDVKVDLGDARLVASIDATQVEQVLVNLCLNARDAMPEGGVLTLRTRSVTLTGDFIAAHPWARPGRYAAIAVTDTGHGMKPSDLQRVFEPFFTTKEREGSSGLGLSVSRGIAEQHGGLLLADSEVGVGSTLSLYLPLADSEPEALGGEADASRSGGPERVLVADDEDGVRRLMVRLLEREGYSVQQASNGAEAVAIAKEQAFDLVILDAVMPRLGGREAFEAIRAQRPETRFLFVTGYGAEQLPERFVAEDNALLLKPFDVDALLRIVRRALDAS